MSRPLSEEKDLIQSLREEENFLMLKYNEKRDREK